MKIECKKGFVGGLVNVSGSDLFLLRNKLRVNNFKLVVLNNKSLLVNGFSKEFGLCCFIQHKKNVFQELKILEKILEKEAGLYLICYKKNNVLFDLTGLKRESAFFANIKNWSVLFNKSATVPFLFFIFSVFLSVKVLLKGTLTKQKCL